MSENKPLCDTSSGAASNGPWLELTYGIMDLVPVLRGLAFPEPFVEKAVLTLIENNPIDPKREVFQWTPTVEELQKCDKCLSQSTDGAFKGASRE